MKLYEKINLDIVAASKYMRHWEKRNLLIVYFGIGSDALIIDENNEEFDIDLCDVIAWEKENINVDTIESAIDDYIDAMDQTEEEKSAIEEDANERKMIDFDFDFIEIGRP